MYWPVPHRSVGAQQPHLLASLISCLHLARPLETTICSKTHQKPPLFTLKACTTQDQTYQTCCSHSSSTTSPDDLAPGSGAFISLPGPQNWNKTNCNLKFGLRLNLQERTCTFYIVKCARKVGPQWLLHNCSCHLSGLSCFELQLLAIAMKTYTVVIGTRVLCYS